MTNPTSNPTPIAPTRVGVILAELGKLNVTVLKYLITHLNMLQRSIEFELLAIEPEDSLLVLLRHGELVDRDRCRSMLPAFRERVMKQLTMEQKQYDLSDNSVPAGLIVISLARFSDEHYGLKAGEVQVQALGEWARSMAPPSIFEFIITLLMRQAASFVAPTVSKSVHLGTKGCLFDFTADLSEARYKALQFFICSVCRARFEEGGAPALADDILQARHEMAGRSERCHLSGRYRGQTRLRPVPHAGHSAQLLGERSLCPA